MLTNDVSTYLHTALWTHIDADGSTTSVPNDISQFDDYAVELADAMLTVAIARCGAVAQSNGWDSQLFAHDLWLTQNRHGSGFWDRLNMPAAVSDIMTVVAHQMGEVNVIDNGDGSLTLSAG